MKHPDIHDFLNYPGQAIIQLCQFKGSKQHTPTFDIDEDAMEIGVGMMVYLAMEELKINAETHQ